MADEGAGATEVDPPEEVERPRLDRQSADALFDNMVDADFDVGRLYNAEQGDHQITISSRPGAGVSRERVMDVLSQIEAHGGSILHFNITAD